MDDPELEAKLNIVLADTMIVNSDTSFAEPTATDVLSALLAMMKRNPDAPALPPTSVRAVRSEDPVDEYGNSDVLFYFALPTLFPFTRGLPECASAIPSKIVRHLFLQFHCRHAKPAKDQRFYYAHFNMSQRHTAVRMAAVRVRNSKPIDTGISALDSPR